MAFITRMNPWFFDCSLKIRYPKTETAMISPKATHPKFVQKRTAFPFPSVLAMNVNSHARRIPFVNAGKIVAISIWRHKEIANNAMIVAAVPMTISRGLQKDDMAGA